MSTGNVIPFGPRLGNPSSPREAAPSEDFTEGALLAIELIEELSAPGAADECSMDPQWHPGKPQRDIVGEHLLTYFGVLAEGGKKAGEVSRGFTRMLSYALAVTFAPGGALPYSGWLELMARTSPEAAHAEWDRLQKEERES